MPVHPNYRSTGSAAAHFGIVGLPDPGRGPNLGDGGIRRFCCDFNRRFDEIAGTTRPEWRSFARAEREAAAAFTVSDRPVRSA